MTEEVDPQVLAAARDLLQRQHDLIEVAGFDIYTAYDGHADGPDIWKAARQGDYSLIDGQSCFIGGARLVAGIDPLWRDELLTDHGDGPELGIALRILDRTALAAADKRGATVDTMAGEQPWSKVQSKRLKDFGPGKIAEAYGFAFTDMDPLDFMRKALRLAAEELGEIPTA